MNPLIAAIDESVIVRLLGSWLTRLFVLLDESLAGRAARRLAHAVGESAILGTLFTSPRWAEATYRSPLLARLAQGTRVRPEGDTQGTELVKLALWGLILFVPVELYAITVLPSSVKYLSDALVAFPALLYLLTMPSRGWAFRASPLDLPILAFVVVGLISGALINESAKIWIFGMRAYLEYAVVFFVVAAAPLSAKDRGNLVLGVVFFGILMALVGVAQHILHIATPHAWVQASEAAQGITTRVPGTMANPNTYAGYLVLLIALLTAFLVEDVARWLKAVVGVGLVLALLALVWTYSREALFAALAVGLVVGIVREPRVLIVMVGLALLAIAIDPKLLDRVLFAFSNTYSAVSSSYGRLYFWQKSLTIIARHPLFGVGPGLFGGSVAHDFSSPVLLRYGLESMSTVDSQWIQTATETGILGLLAILWLIVGIVRTGISAMRRDPDPLFRAVSLAAAAGAVGFTVQAMFAGLLEVHQVVLLLWFTAGIAAWRWRVTRQAPTAQG